MNANRKVKRLAAITTSVFTLSTIFPLPALAFDTDLFTASSTSTAPNVLIVLDNTSNWARQSQQWPSTDNQGQSEVQAIKTVISSLTGYINVGMMEFVTGGPATDAGGYVRFAISPMGSNQSTGPTNKTAFSTVLTTIYNNDTTPNEKQNSNMPYGDLFHDIYNYFAGTTPVAQSADVVGSLADSKGYVSNYTQFKSPLSSDNICAKNYIIFIGNPNASGPANDSASNLTALGSLGGDTAQLPLLQFTQTTQTSYNLDYFPTCMSSAPSSFTNTNAKTFNTSENSSYCPTSSGDKSASYSSCSFNTTLSTNSTCSSGSLRYMVAGNASTYSPASPPVYLTDTNTWNADEWTRFMNQKGIPVVGTTTKATAVTYTIDVYHAQQNASQTSLLTSMAKNGGGRYFSATDANAIKVALQNIFSEIQATNSTFASAALPISATNRTQNDNQVYIGMFRPDQQSFPRWFGNLKRYQFGVVNGSTTLVDAQNQPAVSTTSGFIDNCAQSWWTTDSGNYWANVDSSGIVSPRIFMTTATSAGTVWTTQGDDTNLAKGQCTTNTSGSTYSDLPDGPIVEKGGAAEKLRNSTSRTIATLSGLTGTSVVTFNTSNVTNLSTSSTVNSNIVNFIEGQDITGEIGGTASSTNRPSIHGDVIHSKPLAVDFGTTNGVNVYYGANDGTYRSVNASTGAENWAFVAPEFFSSIAYSSTQTYSPLQRLLDNSPSVQTPTPTPTNNTAAPGSPKDFFFDGSTGLYQNSDSSKVWIYPSMRRGGRMIYAFDESTGVTSKPKVLWKAGCNSSGCTDTQLSNIGQTWSTPNVAFLNGYSTTTPIVVVGGGYDTCEDTDTNPATTSGFCSSPKGAAVYVLDGSTGTLIKSFTTDRSVAADVTLVDVNLDGTVDLAYVADTGGNIYRINFSDPSSNFAALSSSNWTIKKVAYTTGSGRKFLFAPAVLPYQGKVYVAIGSGDREHPTSRSYPYTTPITNRFYVYLDDPSASSSTSAVNMDGSTFLNYTTSSTDTCNSTKVLPNGTNPGWYMDLTENGIGEQVVTSALITSGLVAFSTNRPIAGEVCTNDLGEARGYLVNLLNGSGAITSSGNAICGGVRSSTFVGGGLPPSPVSGVVVINGVAQQVVIGVAQRDSSVSTAISAQKFNPPIKATRSRLYWRTPMDTH